MSAELSTLYVSATEVVDDVQVVVSELITNSCNAAATKVSLAVEGHHTYILVATTDDAPGLPAKQKPSPDMTHGRGLLIVDALASDWGVVENRSGKTVWAKVAVADSIQSLFSCAD